MRAAPSFMACLNARPSAVWQAYACAIDRNFVVIRLKYPAV